MAEEARDPAQNDLGAICESENEKSGSMDEVVEGHRGASSPCGTTLSWKNEHIP